MNEADSENIVVNRYDLEACLSDADGYGGSTWGVEYRARLRAALNGTPPLAAPLSEEAP